eukprot:TRINITY_DN43403_c0_g1_i1.p1 TRINITY_DN43403_c0_g1~~TRINITY_DN43403_c0_g1_i1.p1  ORF type:complete len:145 (-),score=6.75 TRINITY_DN43403_c0_g1_i1:31-465(-)
MALAGEQYLNRSRRHASVVRAKITSRVVLSSLSEAMASPPGSSNDRASRAGEGVAPVPPGLGSDANGATARTDSRSRSRENRVKQDTSPPADMTTLLQSMMVQQQQQNQQMMQMFQTLTAAMAGSLQSSIATGSSARSPSTRSG